MFGVVKRRMYMERRNVSYGFLTRFEVVQIYLKMYPGSVHTVFFFFHNTLFQDIFLVTINFVFSSTINIDQYLVPTANRSKVRSKLLKRYSNNCAYLRRSKLDRWNISYSPKIAKCLLQSIHSIWENLTTSSKYKGRHLIQWSLSGRCLSVHRSWPIYRIGECAPTTAACVHVADKWRRGEMAQPQPQKKIKNVIGVYKVNRPSEMVYLCCCVDRRSVSETNTAAALFLLLTWRQSVCLYGTDMKLRHNALVRAADMYAVQVLHFITYMLKLKIKEGGIIPLRNNGFWFTVHSQRLSKCKGGEPLIWYIFLNCQAHLRSGADR